MALVQLLNQSKVKLEARTELFRVVRGSNGAGTAFESVEENRLIYSPQPACELTEHL
jgi:hypothetical protein